MALTCSLSALGYGGHVGLKDDYPHHGGDSHDYYYFNLQEGTKYRVKIEYDDTFTGSWADKDLRLLVDNNGVFTAHLPAASGYITPEYTVGPGWGCPGTWSCPLRLWIDTGVYSTPSSFPAKGYGGYKVTVIIQEESPPPDLYLTFQSAEWVRQQNHDREDSYNLVIKFQVENTYNKTKTIRNFGCVNAPGLKIVPDTERWDTEINQRAYMMIYYAMMVDAGPHCEESIGEDWTSKYCQYNRLGDDYLDDGNDPADCIYYVSSVYSPNYSIPAHTKIEQTITIPATLAEFQNFDESLQFVLLAIQDREVHPGDSDNDGCHVHGLYFMPARAFIPSVNLLLKN
jgi:hypothetical protein